MSWFSNSQTGILRCMFLHVPVSTGWIVSLLFLLSNCGLAQTVPSPLVTKAPAAPSSPVEAKAPPGAIDTKPPPTAAELQRAAITQQRAAIRRQAETLGLWLMPLDGKPPPAETAESPGCDPLDDNVVNPWIEDAAKSQNLDPKLLRAVIGQESGFRPCAVSAKGAQGLMQLMPETAAELSVANPFDAKQNLDGGARYLKQLIEKYKGDLAQALGAYNAGPKTVDESGGMPDLQETREYVDAILAKAGLKRSDAPAKPVDPPAKPGGTAPSTPQAKPGGTARADPPTQPAGTL